jgi:hypothetical protein
LRYFHRLVIGDVDDKIKLLTWNQEEKIYVFALYFTSTSLLVIILLNLLISIIGETLGEIKSVERYNYNFELANTLLDIDIDLADEKN